MKKFILIALLLVGLSTQASADFPRENSNSAGFVNTATAGTGVDATLVSRPVYVYGVTAYAGAASTFCLLYDAATTPANGTIPKLEIGQATQYQSTRYTYDPPVKFSTGVYADISAGSCVVEYR